VLLAAKVHWTFDLSLATYYRPKGLKYNPYKNRKNDDTSILKIDFLSLAFRDAGFSPQKLASRQGRFSETGDILSGNRFF
jgi:hypothetical protein